MISLSRRCFFVGLGASLVAAPAVVRAANLMQIATFDPLDWPVTPQSIADEAARLLHNIGARRRLNINYPWMGQRHIDAPLPSMPLRDLSERVLAPQMNALAARGYLRSLGCPPMPWIGNGVVEAAIGEYKGTKVRHITFYDEQSDRIVSRFDIGDWRKLASTRAFDPINPASSSAVRLAA